MHGHDAHFVDAMLHIALDLGVGRRGPFHEALQRGQVLPLILQGEAEKLIYRVVGLGAEPSDEAPAPLVCSRTWAKNS